ncbi:deoxyuridine 5'-triphosphate nucleotidohydrolase isoform X9 [Rattus norvegicus]|uniref:deoxyuridine 5'-triphosphate nucleotidohydrolase isoform X9 n=1 Tax=Rattus norvegicus TaxID=10116 RepID=UPI002FD7D713
MPLLCALLRSRLQPSLLRSLTLTSAQSLSCGGSRGVRTWSARTGPGACAAAMPCSEDPAVSVSKRARAEDDASLRFVRLSEHATAPTRGSARAAGYDLYSSTFWLGCKALHRCRRFTCNRPIRLYLKGLPRWKISSLL